MKLEEIGFYTLFDERARTSSETSRMERGEILLTDRCNFQCSYCRRMPEGQNDMPFEMVDDVLTHWKGDDLRNVRFSGGEPMLYPHIRDVVKCADGCEHIAISSNGSLPLNEYRQLIDLGVNDFSISLDACCASNADRMSGTHGSWSTVVKNICELSKLSYVTVGVVVTQETAGDIPDVVQFAHDLGVADIRLISAAQYNEPLEQLNRIPESTLKSHPILAYRIRHFLEGRSVRGIDDYDAHHCHLVLDDSVVQGNHHFPCVIYCREGGDPIGQVGPAMRSERVAWANDHDSYSDPICKRDCLDVCIDYNNQCARYRNANHLPRAIHV